MNNYRTINCEQSAETIIVTLNRPKIDLFNPQMIEELIDVFHSLRTNASARFLILTAVMTEQDLWIEAIDVFWSVAAEYIRQLDHGGLKIVHQLIDGFCGHSLCFFSQMRVYIFAVQKVISQFLFCNSFIIKGIK